VGQRDLLAPGRFIQEIPCREVVHAVEDDVRVAHQFVNVLGYDLVGEDRDHDVRTRPFERHLA
jgi:hypothetical protein